MAFIHWSPQHIPVGAFILPVAQLGGPSRSFGGDYDYAVELGMYDPSRVYVMQTAQLDPHQWFGTFGFTRPEHYMYLTFRTSRTCFGPPLCRWSARPVSGSLSIGALTEQDLAGVG